MVINWLKGTALPKWLRLEKIYGANGKVTDADIILR
jgi:hypothetical protein